MEVARERGRLRLVRRTLLPCWSGVNKFWATQTFRDVSTLERRGHKIFPNVSSTIPIILKSCQRELCPIGAVQGAVADCFRDVSGTDLVAAFEIGNRAAHFENAIVGTGGKTESHHSALEHSLAL